MSMAYAGSLPCGCIDGVIVDMPERPKEVARFVAKMIRDGNVVTRRTVDDIKADPAFLRECAPGGHVVEQGVPRPPVVAS